jgi:membrane-anchored mycosin MYCP
VAAGYVGGVAALVRDRWRGLPGPRIDARLLDTAVPSADGQPYGYGVANAYAAVTDGMVYAAPAAPPTFRPATPTQAELNAQATRDRSRRLAITFTVFGLGVLVIVMLVAVGFPRARRRGWRPAYAAPLPGRTEPDEPAPPALLFDEPATRP